MRGAYQQSNTVSSLWKKNLVSLKCIDQITCVYGILNSPKHVSSSDSRKKVSIPYNIRAVRYEWKLKHSFQGLDKIGI